MDVLPYLDTVIRESMCVSSGIAVVGECVVGEGVLYFPDGWYILTGINTGCNPFVTNRDSGVLGIDADDFNPNRWLQDKNKSAEEFEARSRRMTDTVNFVFGPGGRICVGRKLAMLKVMRLITTLYSLFDVSKSSFSQNMAPLY